MLKDFLSAHRASAMGRRCAWFLVRATCRRSALNMKPLVGTHCILFLCREGKVPFAELHRWLIVKESPSVMRKRRKKG